jgi:hypothetical protein
MAFNNLQNTVANINSGLISGEIKKVLNKPLDVSVSDFVSNLSGYNDISTLGGASNILSAIKADYTLRGNLDEWLFRHYLEDEGISFERNYLTSYDSTPSDNEDPVSFGFDIIIDYANSPLFNGSVENFITNVGADIQELNSRLNLIKQFKSQFFKFFKIDTPGSLSETPPIYTAGKQKARTYYIKKITGLDDLSESINYDAPKQFVDFGKQYLTLTLNEDVTINMGYLASLYRILTWSRLNGKKMFPDNLLRFDMSIIVTESRKFNRVKKNGNGNGYDQFADVISRYIYRIYECQMFFEKLSHDDSIDMTKLDLSEGFDFRIAYKYSTLKFEWLKKYDFQNGLVSQLGTSVLNNLYANLSAVNPSDTNTANLDGTKIFPQIGNYAFNKMNLENLKKVDNSIQNVSDNDGVYHSDSGLRDSYDNTLRDKLLQKTIDNIKQNINSKTGTLLSGFTDDGWSYNIPAYQLNKDSILGSSLIGIINSVIGNFNSGFTDDGWTYNIPAYYINRTLNSLNNTIETALGSANISLSTTQGGINNPSNTFDGIQIDAETWLSEHAELRTNSVFVQNGFGADGYEYNLDAWASNEAESQNKNYVTPNDRIYTGR